MEIDVIFCFQKNLNIDGKMKVLTFKLTFFDFSKLFFWMDGQSSKQKAQILAEIRQVYYDVLTKEPLCK
jgi:hypothetical protein